MNTKDLYYCSTEWWLMSKGFSVLLPFHSTWPQNSWYFLNKCWWKTRKIRDFFFFSLCLTGWLVFCWTGRTSSRRATVNRGLVRFQLCCHPIPHRSALHHTNADEQEQIIVPTTFVKCAGVVHLLLRRSISPHLLRHGHPIRQ